MNTISVIISPYRQLTVRGDNLVITTQQVMRTNKERVLVNDFAFIRFSTSLEDGGRVDIILKGERKSINDMTEKERKDLFELIDECKKFLGKKFNPDGYEIEMSLKGHRKGKSKNLYVSLVPKFEQS